MGAILSLTKSNRMARSKQPDWFLSQGYRINSMSKANILETGPRKDSLVDRSRSPLKELSLKGSARRLSDASLVLPRANSGASSLSSQSMASIDELTGALPGRLRKQSSFREKRESFSIPPKDPIKESWKGKWKTTTSLQAA